MAWALANYKYELPSYIKFRGILMAKKPVKKEEKKPANKK
jgi:hypothetical protein